MYFDFLQCCIILKIFYAKHVYWAREWGTGCPGVNYLSTPKFQTVRETLDSEFRQSFTFTTRHRDLCNTTAVLSYVLVYTAYEQCEWRRENEHYRQWRRSSFYE
jgi:hypothetical protein